MFFFWSHWRNCEIKGNVFGLFLKKRIWQSTMNYDTTMTPKLSRCLTTAQYPFLKINFMGLLHIRELTIHYPKKKSILRLKLTWKAFQSITHRGWSPKSLKGKISQSDCCCSATLITSLPTAPQTNIVPNNPPEHSLGFARFKHVKRFE